MFCVEMNVEARRSLKIKMGKEIRIIEKDNHKKLEERLQIHG
jgi:phage anti-repressor protein